MKQRQPQSETQPAGTWAFLTNHAHVLLCVARDPQSRARDIAAQVGITERAAQRILADLIAAGYITRTKLGRRNLYKINPQGHLRHPVFRDLSIGALIEVLNGDGRPKPRRTPRPSLQA
jgi:DNA-binding MarR family transcriptional regulator